MWPLAGVTGEGRWRGPLALVWPLALAGAAGAGGGPLAGVAGEGRWLWCGRWRGSLAGVAGEGRWLWWGR